MHAKLLPPVQLAGLALLTWSVALIVCPGSQIAARGQALNGCIGGDGYTAPPASVKVIWTSDYTIIPSLQVASASGQIGGATFVHVAFPVPQDLMNATVASVLIHEEAGNTPDVTYANQGLNGEWNPICDDPDPSLPDSPPMLYEDFLWATPPGQNGAYDITVVIDCTTATDGEDPSTYESDSTTLQITVDVENLLITSTTPANPTPILWDPANPTSVSLSCNVTAAYMAPQPVTLNIYDSSQNLVWQQQQTVVLGGSSGGTASFTWDGSTSSVDDDDPPTTCLKGVYLIGFQFVNFPNPPPAGTSPYAAYAAQLLAGPLSDQTAYAPDPSQATPGVVTGQAANPTTLGLMEKAAVVDVFTHGGVWLNGIGIHSRVQFWDGVNWSFIVRTDAAKLEIQANQAGANIICLDDLVTTPPAQPVFSKTLFALLEGCYTTLSQQDTLLDEGMNGANWGDPALGFVEDGGADCALGFKNEIFTHAVTGLPTPNPSASRMEGYGAEEWHVFFWQACCQQGKSISAAARYASGLAASPTNGLYGYRIAGTAGLKIVPARYGA